MLFILSQASNSFTFLLASVLMGIGFGMAFGSFVWGYVVFFTNFQTTYFIASFLPILSIVFYYLFQKKTRIY